MSPPTPLTARDLLALRDGARIRVKRGKSELEVVVKGRPTLEPVGKPGLHRVRLCVFDKTRMPAVTDECWSAMVAFDANAVYEVGGDKVLEVVTPA